MEDLNKGTGTITDGQWVPPVTEGNITPPEGTNPGGENTPGTEGNVVTPPESNNQNPDDKSKSDTAEAEKLKKLVEQYKTPEELAKAKLSGDREFSKIQSEKKVLEDFLRKEQEDKNRVIYESEKKLVLRDKTYLLELAIQQPELATRLGQEVFNKPWAEIETELVKAEEDKILESLSDGTDPNKAKEYVKVDNIDKLVELRLREKMMKESSKLQEERVKSTLEQARDSFLVGKGLVKDSEEYKQVMSTYGKLVEGKTLTEEVSKIALEASYNTFYVSNLEKIKQIETKKQELGQIQGPGGSVSQGSSVVISDDVKSIAKKFNITPERYLELQKKYNEQWRKF